MNTYWSVFWQCRKMYLMYLFEYRSNFFFWVGVSMMWTFFNFFFVHIIGSVTGSIAGWNTQELRLLVSIYTMLDAFTWSFFYHNMTMYTKQIFDGSLGQVLLKPLDPQFLVMTMHNSYSNVPRFFVGLVMMIFSLLKLQWQFRIDQLVVAIVLLIAANMVIYAIWFMLSTLAFWVDKLENINEIMPAFRSVYEFPRQIYSGFAHFILTFILPFGVVAAGPAEVLLGRPQGWLVSYSVVFACFITWISRRFFFISLKKFSGMAN